MSGPVIGYCVRCANDLTAAEYGRCSCPKDGLVEREPDESCIYCLHPTDQHGTEQTGCELCGCSHDLDFACPLGDEKGDE